MLKEIKKLLLTNNLDGYIVPKNDEYFSEYASPDRLLKISKFSGSAGFAILMKNKNYLFVDGRYTLQAQLESGSNFKILEIPKFFPYDLFKNNSLNIKIGFDPKLFTNRMLKGYFKNTCKLVPVNKNLVDEILPEKHNIKVNNFYNITKENSGESLASKTERLCKILKKNKIDNIFISAPENIAWLLNLRGNDNPNSPVPNAKGIITKNKEVYIFTKLSKIKKIRKLKIYKKINFLEESEVYSIIKNLTGKNFCIDNLTCSIFFEHLIRSSFKVSHFFDPCYQLKSIKNNTEIYHTKKTHIYDGVALTKFLYWAKHNNLKNLDEKKAEKKLEYFRKQNKSYLYPSFNTIMGSGPNSAIIHYRSNSKTNRKIKKNDILLCDSGGQYKYGTTDVTRTICFSKPSKNIKNIFTRVLKGHISVVRTNLNKIKEGYKIDKNARYWLKKVNLDYPHGTGHGVGFFLNVHEGPQGLSKYNKVKLKNGMILSNEPGFYKKNKFGIRIENLIYIAQKKGKLFFENLTFAPIDKDLINFRMLNKVEKNYLFKYNLEIYEKISKFLNKKEKNWLLNFI